MAKVVARNHLVARLKEGLIAGLKSSGIQARIDMEPVPGTRLHRVYVIAKKFAKLRPTERQDLVWRILDRHLRPEEQFRISMIYTVTPEEMPDYDE